MSNPPPPSNRTPEALAQLPKGHRLDQYVIVERLASGGMGTLYVARDLMLGRRAALKVVRPDRLRSAEAVERFLFEARTTARFSHPNIVTVYGLGEVALPGGGAAPYLALEHVEGESLSERLRRAPMGAREALRIATAVAEAVAEAHGHGVLHGDLTSNNVLIGSDGRPRVVDFGLAQLVETSRSPAGPGEPDDAHLGPLGGTPAFMAPEQWLGLACTSKTDVWALGALLFTMCAGRPPFTEVDASAASTDSPLGGLPSRREALVCGPEPARRLDSLADVPEPLARLVGRCLEKRSDARPELGEVLAELRALLEPVPHREESDEEQPFCGLSSFTDRQARLFFGRDAEIDGLVERLRTQALVVVVGPSGVGKTSLLHAGVVPRLREVKPWRVLAVRPGHRPFHALAAALAADDTFESHCDSGRRRSASGGRDELEPPASSLRSAPQRLALALRAEVDGHGKPVLLLVDQLEELFTMVSDAEEQAAFVQAVLAAADDTSGPVRVVLALRDDFLGRFAMLAATGKVLGELFVVRPLGAEALEQVARRSVAAFGYRFEDPALTEDLVRPLRGEAAGLPLLQFAGRLLWDRRDAERRVLLRSAFEDIGGAEGALASHADRVIEELPPAAVRVARQLLLRLVSPAGTRLALARTEALAGLDTDDAGGAAAVLTRLVSARLITVSRRRGEIDPTAMVELAHESLVRTWATLARWVEEGREQLALLADARAAAELWRKRGRRREELWRGDALAQARAILRRGADPPPQPVAEFLAAAEGHERRERVLRRLAVLAALVLSSAFAIGAVMVALALADKERVAREQRDLAEGREREVQHRRAYGLIESARVALGNGERLEARAKLRMALQIEDSREARVLWSELRRDPRRWWRSFDRPILALRHSPDGRQVAIVVQNGLDVGLVLVDADTGVARPLATGSSDSVSDVAYSPEGQRLVTGSEQGEIKVIDLLGAGPPRTLGRHLGSVAAVAWSPDGSAVVSVGVGGARTWTLAKGPGPALPVEPVVLAVAFSPDGDTLYAGTETGVLLSWRWRGDGKVARLVAHTREIRSLDVDRRRGWVVSGGWDGKVRVWEPGTFRLLRELGTTGSGLVRGRLSADGSMLAGTGAGRLTVWDLGTGRRAWAASADGRNSLVSFRPHSPLLAEAGAQGVLTVWDPRAGAEIDPTLDLRRRRVAGVAVSPDGQRIAGMSLDRRIRFWDVASGAELPSIPVHAEWVARIGFTPDGRYLAAPSDDATIALWDVQTGKIAQSFGTGGRVWGARVSPDGRLVVAIYLGGPVAVFDRASAALLARLPITTPADIAIRADSKALAVSTTDGEVSLWDLTAYRPLARARPHAVDANGVAFLPGEAGIVSSDLAGKLMRWDGHGPPDLIGEVRTNLFYLDASADGQWVAAGGADLAIHLWNLKTGTHAALGGHRGEPNVVAFVPGADRLVSSGEDASVRVWDVGALRPHWRQIGVLRPDGEHGPPWLASHRGWERIGEGADASAQPPAFVGPRLANALGEAVTARTGGPYACLRTAREASAWLLVEDRRLGVHPVGGDGEILPLPDGCGVVDGDTLVVLRASGPRRLPLGGAPTAIGAAGGVLTVAASGKATAIAHDGQIAAHIEVGPGVVAIGALPASDGPGIDGFVLGRPGAVEVRSVDGELLATLRSVSPANPTRIAAMSPAVVAVGFDDGTVGVWETNGARLEQHGMHGAVTFLEAEQEHLYAASDVGAAAAWDLGALAERRCQLLAQIWAEVPIEWEEGRPVLRAPPSDHACAR